MDAEVAVIGLGTMGSMAMWQLARRGVSVLGFEQFGIGHDQSAAGGETRLFRTAYFEGAEYVPLLQEAYNQWRELEKESGYDLLTINGGLMIGDPESEFIKGVMNSIHTHHLVHEVLDEEAAKERFPQHRLLPGEIMVLDKQAGFLRPELSVLAAVQSAEKLGATVHKYSQVQEIEPFENGVRIKANNTYYRVKKVIITAGPWTGTLLPELQKQLTIQRLVMTWYPLLEKEKFSVANFPTFIRMSRGVNIFGTPTLDGSMVKVALGTFYGEVANADALDRSVDVHSLKKVNDAVRELMSGLNAEPTRVSAYMDAYTPDNDAIIGTHPQFKDALILCGFSGHGFKMAPIFGQIAADLITTGKTEYSIDHLSLTRFL
ncbi:N-methyl-L-tryptophan oxidase [Bacillus sp. FSL K6-3431]|uniref:N-methyl-L-tryptophan oxidase n=1 Tax=Bacillus sp. FSL K6-3431 TaxID=2921500 RepID=UPI0030F6A292